MMGVIQGSCNCGACQFAVKGPVTWPSICHCGQCRKQSGGLWASAVSADTDITITGPVRWYAASPIARRGFCPTCGSFLFWKHNDETNTSFALGALDEGHGIKVERHIFVADQGSYYDIADGLPQKDQ